jgi:NADH dehydrogenase
MHRIVIVGGGYAGTLTAARLARAGLDASVTLVDPKDSFVERVRLHQLAAGQDVPARSYAEILGEGVTFVRGKAVALEADRVVLEDGSVPYDWLVLAVGSVSGDAGVPGAREHAFPIAEPDGAQRLRDALPGIADRNGRVVVVGGGLTGIETAAELAESYPALRVALLSREPVGHDLSEVGRAAVEDAFGRLRVEVVRGAAEAVTAEGVVANGALLPADAVVWAAAMVASPLLRRLGLAVAPDGRAIVDEHLRSVSHPHVRLVGDAAYVQIDGKPLRMSCAAGEPMGAHAADEIARELRGEPLEPFRFSYVVRCVSLGRREGLIQLVDAHDRPRSYALTGRLGAWTKELVCRFAADSLPWQRAGVRYQWLRTLEADPVPAAIGAA